MGQKVINLALFLFLVFNTLQVKAQNIVDTDTIRSRVANNIQNEVQNEEKKFKEALNILQEKSRQIEWYKATTYRDQISLRNKSFLPYVGRDEKFLCSTDCEEKYLFDYLIKSRVQELKKNEPFDYVAYADKQIRDMMLMTSDDNVLHQVTLSGDRNPINDASYLAAYYTQNRDFISAINEAKALVKECNRYGEERNNDFDCKRARSLAEYDAKLLEKKNQEITEYLSVMSRKMAECIKEVLVPLQAQEIAFTDLKTYLNNKDIPWNL